MAIARSWAVAVSGIGGTVVEVEADIGSQLPRFSIIGLADRALAEAEDRVRQASNNSGAPLPPKRVTVNLAPADLPKHGTGFDLAVAVAAAAAAGTIPAAAIDRVAHIGELGLDGRLRAVPGVLPACIAAAQAGFERVMVPLENAAEARLADERLRVVPVRNLREALSAYASTVDADDSPAGLTARDEPPVPEPHTAEEWRPSPVLGELASQERVLGLDFADVHDQPDAVRAAQIAVAGGHHLSMVGPPGSGKSMIAERMAALLPPLRDAEARELSCIRSIAGGAPLSELLRTAPFVAPHHSTTVPALLGGGSARIRPGAVTLASHGVLFIDEAPEMPRHVLNALRQPLESAEVRIHRASGSVVFPARFQLVIAANPCPCGYASSPERECVCTAEARRRYSARLAGPVMDRIDLHVSVRAPRRSGRAAQPSSELAASIRRAREIAEERFGLPNAGLTAAMLNSPQLGMSNSARQLLDTALDRGMLSLRGYDRVRRVARTIADLREAEGIVRDDVEQALYVRNGGR